MGGRLLDLSVATIRTMPSMLLRSTGKRENFMRRVYLSIFCVILFAIGATAQMPTATPAPTTPGQVSRVTYFDVLPGKTDAFTNFIRANSRVILDEQVKQGLIVSYWYFTKPTTEGPGDWDLGLVVTYNTYADAVDANPQRAAKFDAISLRHFGSVEARNKANDLLNEMRTVVSSRLIRRLDFNPISK